MAAQRYEYAIETMFLSPNELQNERPGFEQTLNDRADDGWILDETLRVDGSSFMFVFRRPTDA